MDAQLVENDKVNSVTAVAWNSWQAGAPTLAGLGNNESRSFARVEAGNNISSAISRKTDIHSYPLLRCTLGRLQGTERETFPGTDCNLARTQPAVGRRPGKAKRSDVSASFPSHFFGGR